VYLISSLLIGGLRSVPMLVYVVYSLIVWLFLVLNVVWSSVRLLVVSSVLKMFCSTWLEISSFVFGAMLYSVDVMVNFFMF